ncbi:hypothetical protein [Acinetobacter schindleri]|uniref:hypothetical protein n=1 Tax=Acinetobacter schindleri TaxID=108981 RepID=UPI00160E1464|nr:hypothetical protein [Acinetobacter schindleri]MBB4835452.1 RNA polymerase-binding transcription factor DksA [Acinetobacter schindleri]
MSSPTPNNSYKELLGILGAITLIFLLWISYPRFMQYMDDAPEQKSVQMVIPYTLDAMLTTEPTSSESVAEEKTKFQKIGDQYGTYGDSYGSLNTLFSGLAFAILIISLFMQRQELQAQRQELEAQRNEIKESNAIADKQREITEQQAELNAQQIHDAKVENFYNLLFRFLDEKRRKIENLELSLQSRARGNYVFKYFLDGALKPLQARFLYANHIESETDEDIQLIFEDVIDYGHSASKDALIESEYFEYTCFILRFIEEYAELGITDTAIKIFVSYQSINEMFCMFIISLDDEELQSYIKKYALLRKLNTYDGDKHLMNLIDKVLGEEAYTP